ncbi:hypothetical protein [Spiribacter pallidus]|uniref:hypothetical protein n=1 Tax=Spiribacter pallidus TaxID=1987936 RepID=UPI0034A00FD3
MKLSNEMLTIEVEKTLHELQSKHAEWDKQQRYADTLLYTLLEGCLDFYYFVRKDERYESAFKSVCDFKWNSKTTLATLITKAVFGAKAKKGYAYAKALAEAVRSEIGVNGNVGMAQWLKENGGVNGVIRNEKGESTAKAERDYRILVGKNSERFGIKAKVAPIHAPQLAEVIGDEECVMLVARNADTEELIVKYMSNSNAIKDRMYERLGELTMGKEAYREKRAEVIEEIEQEGDEATQEVLEALNAVKSKVAQAEEEEALEAA